MNWIDPKVQLPEEGKIYLVLLEFNNTKVVFIASAGYPRRYNSKTKKYEPMTDKLGWKSLYDPTRTRAVIYNGDITSEYKQWHKDNPSNDGNTYKERRRWRRYHEHIETVPHFYSVSYTVAYIAIEDIDYPTELMKAWCMCPCGGKK